MPPRSALLQRPRRSAAFRRLVVALGAVAYWELDEPAGTSGAGSVKDAAGANHGTPAGGVTFGQRAAGGGAAALFDGATGYVGAADAAALRQTGDLTIVAAVYLASLPAAAGVILSKNGNASVTPAPYTYFLVGSPASLPRLTRGNGTLSANVDASVGLTTGWHLVAVTMAGTTVTHYTDGAANGTGTLSTTIADGGRPALIGARNAESPSTFAAYPLDKVALFPTALTAAQMLQLYRAWRAK